MGRLLGGDRPSLAGIGISSLRPIGVRFAQLRRVFLSAWPVENGLPRTCFVRALPPRDRKPSLKEAEHQIRPGGARRELARPTQRACGRAVIRAVIRLVRQQAAQTGPNPGWDSRVDSALANCRSFRFSWRPAPRLEPTGMFAGRSLEAAACNMRSRASRAAPRRVAGRDPAARVLAHQLDRRSAKARWLPWTARGRQGWGD
jgi:hypothetical protein